METGCTFATLLTDVNLRRQLIETPTVEEFKQILVKHSLELVNKQRESSSIVKLESTSEIADSIKTINVSSFSTYKNCS